LRLNGRVAGALLALMFVGAAISSCGSSPAPSGGPTTSSTTSAASRGTAGTAPTLAALTASVHAQLTGTGSSDFAVTGISQLTCALPAGWEVRATFKCFAYDFAKDEIGEYDGTVQPESGGQPQWNGQWIPK
jgi:hypothetical protein